MASTYGSFRVSRSSLSLIVADDHPLMRAGIKEVLSADRLYDLAAIAVTGAECVELIARLRPDVAIIDINISHPGAAGILREVKLNHWQTRVCFLTEDQVPRKLRGAEADGSALFVDARAPEDLRNRLREIAVDLLGKGARAARGPVTSRETRPARTGSGQRLTQRQHQIVAMLKIGSSNREIAHVLGLSEGTVKVHLHRLYQKAGVSNRTQLAAKSFGAE